MNEKQVSRIQILAITVIMTVLFVLFFEILARFFLWSPINPYDAYREAVETQQDTEYTVIEPFLGDADGNLYASEFGDLAPNQNGTWNIWPHRPYHVVTNSVGLRNDEELWGNDETFRILAIGDSFTFGPYVANEDTWTLQLQALMRQQYPEFPIQVLNSGISGYTISDQYDYLVDKGLALEPDLVILNFTINDISDMIPERDYLRRNSRDLQPFIDLNSEIIVTPQLTLRDHARNFLENFALFNLVRIVRFNLTVRDAIATPNDGTGAVTNNNEVTNTDAATPLVPSDTILFFEADRYQAVWEAYEQTLRDTLTLLQENDIPVLVVAFPAYYQLPENTYPDTPQQLVQSVTEDLNIPYLDLLPIYRESGTIESLFLMQYTGLPETVRDTTFGIERWLYTGNGHPSRYGYWVAADAIRNEIDITISN